MSDFLNSQFQITYVKETPPESIKLMNFIKKQQASSHESGERKLQTTDSEINLVDNSTNIYIASEKPIKIILSSGETFENMEMFAYSGKNKISVSVINTSSVENRVVYAAGNLLDN